MSCWHSLHQSHRAAERSQSCEKLHVPVKTSPFLFTSNQEAAQWCLTTEPTASAGLTAVWKFTKPTKAIQVKSFTSHNNNIYRTNKNISQKNRSNSFNANTRVEQQKFDAALAAHHLFIWHLYKKNEKVQRGSEFKPVTTCVLNE